VITQNREIESINGNIPYHENNKGSCLNCQSNSAQSATDQSPKGASAAANTALLRLAPEVHPDRFTHRFQRLN
jgi:hypothetical protein